MVYRIAPVFVLAAAAALSAQVPDATTAAVYRLRVAVPAGQTVTLDVDEIKPGTTTYEVNELHRDRLRVIITNADARETVERAMAPIFAKSAEIDAIEADMLRRNEEMDRITADQSRVRENMRALGDTSAERRLLERYSRQFEEQENQVDALKKELAALQARQAAAERELNELIAALSIDITP